MYTYKCENCGGEFIIPLNHENIKNCICCNNIITIKENINCDYNTLKIRKIVPFNILKNDVINHINYLELLERPIDDKRKISSIEKIYFMADVVDFDFDINGSYCEKNTQKRQLFNLKGSADDIPLNVLPGIAKEVDFSVEYHAHESFDCTNEELTDYYINTNKQNTINEISVEKIKDICELIITDTYVENQNRTITEIKIIDNKITNVKKEIYKILLPVYLIKFDNGEVKYVSGFSKSLIFSLKDNLRSLFIILTIIGGLVATGFLVMFMSLNDSIKSKMPIILLIILPLLFLAMKYIITVLSTKSKGNLGKRILYKIKKTKQKSL